MHKARSKKQHAEETGLDQANLRPEMMIKDNCEISEAGNVCLQKRINIQQMAKLRLDLIKELCADGFNGKFDKEFDCKQGIVKGQLSVHKQRWERPPPHLPLPPPPPPSLGAYAGDVFTSEQKSEFTLFNKRGKVCAAAVNGKGMNTSACCVV